MVLGFYDLFFGFLKFVLKNNDLPQFIPYSLVENYSKFLFDFRKALEARGFQYTKLEYHDLLKIIFKSDLNIFLPLINESQKKELILNFGVLVRLYDCLIDRDKELGINEIKSEIRKFRKELNLLMEHFRRVSDK